VNKATMTGIILEAKKARRVGATNGKFLGYKKW
jgi:hypothetical protein